VKWQWMIPLVPAGVGVILFVVLLATGLPNPILYLRADLATLALMLGLFLAFFSGVNVALWWWERSARERELAQVASQAADERRRFLRRLDHEVKNPLTAIRAGLANLAAMPEVTPHGEALSSIEAQVMRLSRLLADLRKLAEFETQPIERTQVDLAALLEEVYQLAGERPEAAERRITLTMPQAPWPLPSIYADWDLLFLAVHNLVDNAIKYTLPGNTIEIRAFEDDQSVVIEVADTGPGIPESELPHVWEELSRGYSARGVPGSGLGLALVRTITERHGGRVMLRSRAGHGTVFTMRLPVSTRPTVRRQGQNA
jgi:two-component system OmpR family sensor kinase